MEWKHYATCLWPGLADLWWRGRLSSLSLAIPFAVGLNLYLITRFIYPNWISPGLVSIAFWVGVIAWGFYVVRSTRELPGMLRPRAVSEQPDRFPEAREAYLRGNWTAAERMLQEVLSIEPRDPPALLLLTGVYRHTERLESAEILLEQVARLEVSDSWFLEIQAEARRIRRAMDALSDTDGLEPTTRPNHDHSAAELTASTSRAA